MHNDDLGAGGDKALRDGLALNDNGRRSSYMCDWVRRQWEREDVASVHEVQVGEASSDEFCDTIFSGHGRARDGIWQLLMLSGPPVSHVLESSTESVLYLIHLLNEASLNRDINRIEGDGRGEDDSNVEGLGEMAAMAVVVLSSKGTQECL